MNRTILNIIIDLLAALLFLGMIATGYILRFPLPPGTNKSHILWSLSRHQWGEIHFWISLGLLVTMMIHLVLHWNWIVTVIGKRCHLVKSSHPSLFRCGAWTLGIIILSFTAFAWFAQTSVQEIDRPMRRGLHRQVSEPVTPAVQTEDDQPLSAFRKEIYPIFEKNCLACHGPQKQFAGFRVDQREDWFGGNGGEALILPGQAEASPLIAIVSGTRKNMPMAANHTLTQEDVARIKSWIDAGAQWAE